MSVQTSSQRRKCRSHSRELTHFSNHYVLRWGFSTVLALKNNLTFISFYNPTTGRSFLSLLVFNGTQNSPNFSSANKRKDRRQLQVSSNGWLFLDLNTKGLLILFSFLQLDAFYFCTIFNFNFFLLGMRLWSGSGCCLFSWHVENKKVCSTLLKQI